MKRAVGPAFQHQGYAAHPEKKSPRKTKSRRLNQIEYPPHTSTPKRHQKHRFVFPNQRKNTLTIWLLRAHLIIVRGLACPFFQIIGSLGPSDPSEEGQKLCNALWVHVQSFNHKFRVLVLQTQGGSKPKPP